MAKKTVIRRMAKRLPSSADVDQVIMNDNEASGFTQIQPRETINITPMPEDQTTPLSRLKASMGSEGIVDNATGEIISEEKNEQPADA